MATRTTAADPSTTTSRRKALPPSGAEGTRARDDAGSGAPAADRTVPHENAHPHRQAAQHAIHSNSTHLDLRLGPVHAHLDLPPVDKLAYYAGLAGAAAFGVIEWPIAVIAGVGHLLADDRRNRTIRALGEALDAV